MDITKYLYALAILFAALALAPTVLGSAALSSGYYQDQAALRQVAIDALAIRVDDTHANQ